jgi:hypothetical protein
MEEGDVPNKENTGINLVGYTVNTMKETCLRLMD